MKLCLSIPLLVILVVLPLAAAETLTEEIDRTVWSAVAATVVAHDIEGMAEVYHPDAVLVSSRGTVAIAEQLIKWGEGMERYKEAGTTASVSFRFETRQDDEATAFEAGMFKYTETTSDGSETSSYVPFEALLVKKDGRWLMVMERQLEAADESAWDAMSGPRQ